MTNTIDTIEAGAGSYPSAPEDKEKCYEFKAVALCEIEGYVYAGNYDKAEELIKNNYFDERYIENIKQVEEVAKLVEVKEGE